MSDFSRSFVRDAPLQREEAIELNRLIMEAARKEGLYSERYVIGPNGTSHQSYSGLYNKSMSDLILAPSTEGPNAGKPRRFVRLSLPNEGEAQRLLDDVTRVLTNEGYSPDSSQESEEAKDGR